MPTLLVGTQPEVRLLADQLALAATPAAGVVAVGEGAAVDLDRAVRASGATLAILTAPRGRRLELSRARLLLERLGVPTRFVAPLSEQVDTRAAGRERPRVVDADALDLPALIGRTPHAIDRQQVASILTGKTVLITGAGGSIGSELTRICASFQPARLVMMERSENALFEIDRTIASRFPALDRVALLHDVVDAPRTLELVQRFAPHAVFHAAAHKHVPLMEDHPAHAVTNNLFGTKSIADAAVAAGAERFVLISSDKAVRPSSVMGATKRLAERYVQGLAAQGGHSTRLSMVRFGNVLGSSGSVLTIWGAQLGEGGPLTVTDERMTRYFMTIAEAASLVVQAAAFSGALPERAGSGEVFVLDMGQPVRILDLAARFAMASGFTPVLAGREPPETDCPVVEIVLTEARPGEKLHEQLAYLAEHLGDTPHPGIRALASVDAPDAGEMTALVAAMEAVRSSQDRAEVLRAIRRHVSDISPGGDLGRPDPQAAGARAEEGAEAA